MFKSGLRLPFLAIAQDLLGYLNLALSQIKPKGWRCFLSCCILWPFVLGEGNPLTIKEFLYVYRAVRYNWLFSSQVREKSKVISLRSSYSSNKKWETFFFVSRDLEFPLLRVLYWGEGFLVGGWNRIVVVSSLIF
jgi:hypothetical protein